MAATLSERSDHQRIGAPDLNRGLNVAMSLHLRLLKAVVN
jgi:hypothetical protein